ncbi:tetraacyldisaccharide 4'-kinase [Sodalis sp. CWE]|uniref:tetraacyldisaccharide 4'-kinase n=1 Tax=Sodalis sp. CWE TaxID=2803816 RepID=UPI00351D2E25
MIFYIWFRASRLYWILLPFSWLYGLTTAFIRYSYQFNWLKVHRFPTKIVVVGNLTVGGNGKTPVVLWLVDKLQKKGYRVGVVARGYGGKAKRYPLLLNASTTSDQCGDEPLLIWRRTGVPIAVAPKRVEAVKALLQTYPLDVIITDDGLQHYALGRDIEWIVVDGDRRFGNGWWLPAGPMRERTWRLETVQAIITNGNNNIQFNEVSMTFTIGNAINILNGEQRALTSLKLIVAMAGISYPPRFFSILRKEGITPLREVTFKDHQVYRQCMLDELVSPEEQLLMTEKDAVKCFDFARINWWYLPINVQIPLDVEKKLLKPILQAIKDSSLLSLKSKY